MKALGLSPRAERSLDEIAEFSARTIGVTRGRRYVHDIMRRCRDVATGRLPHQSCSHYFVAELRDDLRFIRAGSHFVIFLDETSRILVVDVIHQSVDIDNRLESIWP